jgi:ParB/RepB/Spo0J family partition protein
VRILPEIVDLDLSLIDPSPVNPRHGVSFDALMNRELYDDIARRGQQLPVFVRKSAGRYELITGARRFGAIRTLEKEKPGLKIRAQIVEADDLGAWRLADAENAGRRDITPMQRARSLHYACKQFLNGNQAELAKRIGRDPSVVSRTLKLLDIPDEVLAALKDPEGVSVNFADKLSEILDDPDKRRRALEEAARLAKAHAPMSAPKLLLHLRHSVEERAQLEPVEVPLGHQPRQAVLKRDEKGRVTITIQRIDDAILPRARRAFVRTVEGELSKLLKGAQGAEV